MVLSSSPRGALDLVITLASIQQINVAKIKEMSTTVDNFILRKRKRTETLEMFYDILFPPKKLL